jgi:hypothetical protein
VRAGIRGGSTTPERANNDCGFFELRYAHTRWRERVAIRTVLDFGVSRAESENKTPTRQELQRDSDFRREGRIPIALAEDQCAPTQPGVTTGVIREERQALEDRIRVELEVVDDPTREIVLGGSLQYAIVGPHHFGQRAAMRRWPNGYAEVDSDHYSRAAPALLRAL